MNAPFFELTLSAAYSTAWCCFGCVIITSRSLSLSIFSSAWSRCCITTLFSPARSASSPATLISSSALLASPCSRAAYAEHFSMSPSESTFGLNAFLHLSRRMSCICIALYVGNIISSSDSDDFTLGSRFSTNIRSFDIPIIASCAFCSSELSLVKL